MTAQLTTHLRLPAAAPLEALPREPQVFAAAGYYTWLNPKYIRLESPGEVPRILKLAKPLRSRSPLADGTWVYVRGTCKLKDYAPKFRVEELSTSPLPQAAEPDRACLTATRAVSKTQDVAVCLKKNCCKRGAEAIWAALEATPELNPVESGCLKACKHGPAIAIGQRVYSGTSALAELQSALK
ncbi:MAG: (2Fe-2S) ferredoxin domain-containing protein [Synechococcaceae cyanobacterium SM2_3_60]|nr:(2Fe-2S) ferredoxin domain-containing protein [Synechococcaceae cyanobacterium SM2_3_60]